MKTPTRVVTFLLSAGLLWQSMPVGWASAASPPSGHARAGTLQTRYPNARVYRVTEAQFRQIKPLLGERPVCETFVLAQAGTTAEPDGVVTNDPGITITNRASAATNDTAVGISADVPGGGPPPLPGPPPPVEAWPALSPDPSPAFDDRTCTGVFDLIGDLGNLDSDAAIVIFIVVGVTAVLAVVVYSGALLYRAASGVGGYTYWWDTELHTATLVGGGDSGTMAALRIGSGVDMREARLGVILEGGYLDGSLRLDGVAERVDVEGGFALGGAGVRWPLGSAVQNASFFGIELLAGKVWDANVNLMSVARSTLSLGLGEHLRLGFSLGALYLGLDAEDGLVKHADNFTTMLGLEAGVRF